MRVAIIGAGIAGIAHAWMAAEGGHSVTLFERSARASGGSIRNFGMVWPIGQPAGVPRKTALRSRQRWLELTRAAGIWVNECGSIHLAHHEDEWRVLQEFAAFAADQGIECGLLDAQAVTRLTPAANPQHLIGGLHSPTELCVNPPKTIRAVPRWLESTFDVQFAFSTAITRVAEGRVFASDGRQWDFDRIIVCGGADFVSLFPEAFAESGLRRCKLQMLKTRPQPDGWRIGPHLASGLTLRHYANFEVCPSLRDVKERIARDAPELDQFGIHVMASQNDEGGVILGDSHEYDAEIEPFDQAIIDELMLRELRKILALPDWTIVERWHGYYAKGSDQPVFALEPLPEVHIRTGLGGAGMTMAFGLAEADWENWQ